MGLRCRLGWHSYRDTQIKRLPPVLPEYPSPAYVQMRCRRCGDQTWDLRPDHQTPNTYNPALHADYHAGAA